MMILVVIMVFFLRNRFLAESQQKEIAYLKEINRGMEMLVQKNNEIRHYQRIQSLGIMASHIAHEFNNYLTPVLIYAELLEMCIRDRYEGMGAYIKNRIRDGSILLVVEKKNR